MIDEVEMRRGGMVDVFAEWGKRYSRFYGEARLGWLEWCFICECV